MENKPTMQIVMKNIDPFIARDICDFYFNSVPDQDWPGILYRYLVESYGFDLAQKIWSPDKEFLSEVINHCCRLVAYENMRRLDTIEGILTGIAKVRMFD